MDPEPEDNDDDDDDDDDDEAEESVEEDPVSFAAGFLSPSSMTLEGFFDIFGGDLVDILAVLDWEVNECSSDEFGY